jgi:hypothetical protein
MNRTIAISSAAALSVFIVALCVGTQDGKGQQSQPAATPGKYVDKDGTIRLPEDYRLKWTHLGSWYVEGEKKASDGLHDVYAEPEAVRAFQNTGKWPQGATIVKEIRASREGKMTTGNAHWDGQIIQWFVMVKDTNHTFAGNPNWGRGWGWALYSIDDPKKNTSTDYKIDCIGCHVPAQETDWIFTHGYPTLFEKEGPFKKYSKENYDGNKPIDVSPDK